jgi:photosystem II stability/assembly factor-like uncharacterized protein
MNVNHLILGPADGVDRNGRIEESRDGGQTWKDASVGLKTPWRDHMVERFYQVDHQLLAVLSNGELVSTDVNQINWKPVLNEVPDISSLALVE